MVSATRFNALQKVNVDLFRNGCIPEVRSLIGGRGRHPLSATLTKLGAARFFCNLLRIARAKVFAI